MHVLGKSEKIRFWHFDLECELSSIGYPDFWTRL